MHIRQLPCLGLCHFPLLLVQQLGHQTTTSAYRRRRPLRASLWWRRLKTKRNGYVKTNRRKSRRPMLAIRWATTWPVVAIPSPARRKFTSTTTSKNPNVRVNHLVALMPNCQHKSILQSSFNPRLSILQHPHGKWITKSRRLWVPVSAFLIKRINSTDAGVAIVCVSLSTRNARWDDKY